MAKRIFIIIIVIGVVVFFLPTSIKLQITKYPRIVLLLPLDGINNFVINLHSQRKEYHRLSELATKLTIENAQLKNQIIKNQLSNTINTFDLVQASIIARDNETGVRFFTINKSSHSNIKYNMPVLTAHGVVGKIIETNENQSIVETALSPGLKISAQDQRSRVVGVIEYSNFAKLRFKYAFAESDIQIGDTIISSGLGGIFPRGLNIGIVINVRIDPTRFFQYIEVKPTVNFNTLEEVFVLTSEIKPYDEMNSNILKQRNLQNLKIEIPITPRMR